MDYFSKWPEVFALKNQTADTIVECLLDVFTRHGTPKILLSDKGRNFESNRVKKLCNAMDIDKRRTSPYHPECDGMVEKFNRTLLDMLAMYVNDYHSDWDMWIPQVTFAYRTSIHSSTNVAV
jgi:transposase InsO family protein